MAKKVLTDAFVSINAVDLSDHVNQVTLNYQAELQDSTTMGADTRERLGGLKDWSLEIDFYQDFDAAEVDATLFPLVGATFTAIVREDKTAGVSATNPNYSGTGILESYPPLGGSIGEMSASSVTIQAAGTLSRLVA